MQNGQTAPDGLYQGPTSLTLGAIPHSFRNLTLLSGDTNSSCDALPNFMFFQVFELPQTCYVPLTPCLWMLASDFVNVVRRQKALGFNSVRLPFTMPDLFTATPTQQSHQCPYSGSNPSDCDIVSSVLKPGQSIPAGVVNYRMHPYIWMAILALLAARSICHGAY